MTGFTSKRAMARERFGMVFEDPMYDEDGNCVDEDFDFDDVAEVPQEEFDPNNTVNS